ncbi:PspC domain-containing protein, partial [Georgenia sp. 311]
MNGQSAPHTPPPPSSPAAGFFDSVRRLGIWRTPDRWVGGVAAGIGHRYGLDPLLVRGFFVVVSLFGGLGLVLYGVAWALLPESSDGRIHLEQAVRGHFDIALAGAAAAVIVGLSRPVFWWSGAWWTVPWVIIVGVVV